MYDYGARFYDPSIARFISVDPLADAFPSWSSYSYVFNNPLIFTDPTGMAPEWIDNGDGTFTAEVGDSANSLAKDANISLEEADEIVQAQFGPNYEGADGEMKSNIDPDDVVDVCCSEKNDIKQVHLDKVDELNTSKESSQATIKNLAEDRDSMKKERLDFMNDPRNKSEPGDPGGGMNFYRTIIGTGMEKRQKLKEGQIDSVDKVIKNQNRALDSLKKYNG